MFMENIRFSAFLFNVIYCSKILIFSVLGIITLMCEVFFTKRNKYPVIRHNGYSNNRYDLLIDWILFYAVSAISHQRRDYCYVWMFVCGFSSHSLEFSFICRHHRCRWRVRILIYARHSWHLRREGFLSVCLPHSCRYEKRPKLI